MTGARGVKADMTARHNLQVALPDRYPMYVSYPFPMGMHEAVGHQAAATGSPTLSMLVLCTTSVSLVSISSLQNLENSRLSPLPRRTYGPKQHTPEQVRLGLQGPVTRPHAQPHSTPRVIDATTASRRGKRRAMEPRVRSWERGSRTLIDRYGGQGRLTGWLAGSPPPCSELLIPPTGRPATPLRSCPSPSSGTP